MVFANLTERDKEAFFTLLDEYFASRPGVAEALQLQTSPSADRLSVAAVSDRVSSFGRALSNQAQNTPNVPQRPSSTVGGSSNRPSFSSAASNPDLSNAIGRVAAASMALNNSGGPRVPPPPAPSTTGSRSGRPSIPARRAASTTSSAGESERSMSSQFLPPPQTAPALRGPSGLKRGGDEAASKKSPPVAPRRGSFIPRTRSPSPEPEPEEEGSWAEALYDFSGDAGDLTMKAGQNILVTEQTSDAWWTGQVDGTGKSGLFPSSYVKLL